MDFNKLVTPKPEVAISKTKSRKAAKKFIILIEPNVQTRKYYTVYVHSVREGHIIEVRQLIKHERIRRVLEKVMKHYNRKSCKIVRNYKS